MSIHHCQSCRWPLAVPSIRGTHGMCDLCVQGGFPRQPRDWADDKAAELGRTYGASTALRCDIATALREAEARGFVRGAKVAGDDLAAAEALGKQSILSRLSDPDEELVLRSGLRAGQLRAIATALSQLETKENKDATEPNLPRRPRRSRRRAC